MVSLAIIAAAALSASPSPILAPLADEPGITVLVENLPIALKEKGLSEDDVESIVDGALRPDGVMQSADGPTLYVSIGAVRITDSGAVAGNVEVLAYRIVPADRGYGHLVLWRASEVFAASDDKAAARARQTIAHLVKSFADDWKAAHAQAHAWDVARGIIKN